MRSRLALLAALVAVGLILPASAEAGRYRYGAYGYDGARNRAVTVSAEMITLALREVYDMDQLADELAGSR